MIQFNPILNGESGFSVRNKLNTAFKDIIEDDKGLQGIWTLLESADFGMQYLHIMFSAIENPTLPSEISAIPNDYMGLMVSVNPVPSSEPADYTWFRIKGEKGEPGSDAGLGEYTVMHSTSTGEYTDTKLMSALRTVNEINQAIKTLATDLDSKYLSKVKKDSAAGTITFLDGMVATKEGIATGAYEVNIAEAIIETKEDGTVLAGGVQEANPRLIAGTLGSLDNVEAAVDNLNETGGIVLLGKLPGGMLWTEVPQAGEVALTFETTGTGNVITSISRLGTTVTSIRGITALTSTSMLPISRVVTGLGNVVTAVNFENNVLTVIKGETTVLASVRVIAGIGLTGGGSLTEDRTFNLAISGVTAGTWTKLVVDAYGRAIEGGLLLASDIPDLDADKIVSGVLGVDRIPSLPASKITSGTLAVGLIPNIDAAKITTGTLPLARGGTGKNSIAAGSMYYASAANVLSELATSSFGRGLLNTTSGTKITGLYAETAGKTIQSLTFAGGDSVVFNGAEAKTVYLYNWARASVKPSYAFSEITGTIALSQLPSLSGTYVDLSSEQTIGGSKTFTAVLNANGTVVLPNNTGVYGKDSTGANYTLTRRDSANNSIFGTTVYQSQIHSANNQVYIWNGATGGYIWHSANSNLATVNWAANNLSAAGSLTVAGNTTLSGTLNVTGATTLGGVINANNTIILPNSVSLQGKDTSGTTYNLIHRNSSNHTLVGTTTYSTVIYSANADVYAGNGTTNYKIWAVHNSNLATVSWAANNLTAAGTLTVTGTSTLGTVVATGAITANSSIILPNNIVLQAKDTGGTNNAILYKDTTNVSTFGDTTYETKIRSGAYNLQHNRAGNLYTILDTYNVGSYALPVTGGTISGTLTLTGALITAAEKYYADGYYGINLRKSDIIGVNGIYFQDLYDSRGECINFYRSAGYWDSLGAANGVLYFSPNRATETHTLGYTVYHSGNLTAGVIPDLSATYVNLTGAQTISGAKTFKSDMILARSIKLYPEATSAARGFVTYNQARDTVIAGIGTHTIGDALQRLYMGWGTSPWSTSTSFSVSSTELQWAGKSIYHSGNSNLSTISWSALNLSAAGTLSVAGTTTLTGALNVTGAITGSSYIYAGNNIVLTTNNTYLYGRNTSNVSYPLIGMDSSNYIVAGYTSYPLLLSSSAVDLIHNRGGSRYPILDTYNYNSYVPSLTGTGASGTWGISITGNAANSLALGGHSQGAFFKILRGNTTISSNIPTTAELTTLAEPGSYIINYPGASGHLFVSDAGGVSSTRYMQIYSTYSTDLVWRNSTDANLSNKPWRSIIDHVNVGTYALPITGGTITGNLTVTGTSTLTGAVSMGSSLTVTGIAYVKSGSIFVGSATSSTGGVAGLHLAAGAIELMHATPYLDFHFANSTADYTSRLIESTSGTLSVYNRLYVNTTGSAYNFAVNGTSYFTGAIVSDSTLYTAGTMSSSTRIFTGYDSGTANSVSCSNWFRSSGQSGWLNDTYGGGIYMTDTTWLRVYNGKKFYVSDSSYDAINTAGGVYATGALRAGTTLTVGGAATLTSTLAVSGISTLSGGIVAPYTAGSSISTATRSDIIQGNTAGTSASAHGLFRVKSYSGDAVVFGGLGNNIGFWGFLAANVNSGANVRTWVTEWTSGTGHLYHSATFGVGGAVTFSSTLAVSGAVTMSNTLTVTGAITTGGKEVATKEYVDNLITSITNSLKSIGGL